MDGTILNITHTFELGLVIVFDVLATMGLIFTTGCLLFNIIFRNRKYGLTSSPGSPISIGEPEDEAKHWKEFIT